MNHPKGQTHRVDVANSKPVLSKGAGSPELYRLLFAAASGAILVLQNGGESGWQVVECNAGAAGLLGYEREKLLGQNLLTFCPPTQPDGRSSAELLADKIAAALTGESQRFEWLCRRGDQAEFDAHLALSALEFEDDTLLQLSLQDISSYKQAQAELRRLAQAVEQSANTVVITDTRGYIQYANPKFTETTGYTLEEALGQHTRILKSGETAPDEYKALWQTISAGKEWRGEFHNKKKNGELYWELASISPIRDQNGVITHFLAVKEDVTERKRAEEAVRESRQMLQLIMDNIPQSIFWKDKELNYLGCNQNFARDAGLASADEVIGKSDFEMPWLDQAELYRADDRRVMEAGEPVLNYEEPQTTPAGSQIWLRTSKVPLRDASGNVMAVLGMYEDITASKKAEQELKQYRDQLEELVAARTAELEERVRELNALQRLMSREGWQEYQAARRQAASAYLFDQMAVRPVARTELALPGNGQQQTEPTGDSRTTITPLAVSGEKIGALGVYADPAQPLSAEEQAFLEAVAGQVAEALERARLLEQSRISLAETEQLFQAGRRLTEAGSLPEILAAVMEVGSIPAINRALLFVFERDPAGEVETLTVAANWYSGAGTPPTPVGTRYSKEMLTALNFVLGSEPVFVDDPEQDERIDPATRAILQRLNVRSVAAIPLWVGARQVGSLLLEAEEAHHFSEQEIRLNLSLADQAAVAIDNQRLLQETQAALAEVEATQRRYTLQAWESYRAKRAAAASYEQTREGVPPLGEERLAELARIRPLTADGGPPQVDGGEASLIVPLMVRETVIGLLGLQATAERDWSPEEVALVEAIAEQVAQAAENLRLFDETQQRAARERRVGEIGDKIRAAQSLEEALQVAIKEVGLSLKAPQTMVQLAVE